MYDAYDITDLSNLISDTVSSLVQICNAHSLHIPRLDEKFTQDSESFRSNKDAGKAIKIITGAALQLAATLMPPQETIFQVTHGHFKTAAMRVAVSCHVPEILRDAGPKGLHSKTIAEKSGVDDGRLARLLRYLANRHVFREVAPDVFTHNRISGMLDTGKPVDVIFQDPESKHDGTNGFVALVELYTSDGHKGSSYLLENMKDPKTSHATEANQGPMQRGLGTEMSYWEWYSQPERLYERRRFGVAMKGVASMEPPGFILKAFDWSSLSADSIIIDVAGGIGISSMEILKAFPHLNIIVQDIPAVVEEAVKFWEKELPDALVSQRIKLQAHDMFTPQPIQNASIFLLKDILHNWPDAYSVKLLTHLREAATPTTRLLIFDTVLPYTCDNTGPTVDEFATENNRIPGLSLGSANEMPYSRDIAMMVWLNAQEHTLGQFRALFKISGWRMVGVTRDGFGLDYVEALPS
ncbi:S-adenosyl-L-methionine-dependent methyltransferase [Collybia nuda]|uniref:S-adenosyl-L-methionine-dependent methyltransferase n=1 Tax=Collybia nuda TaxID=64659 RepID=A0A9P5XXK7_9AGAR|nr:S-adenosyl-L-methionine-dependent methyltransferase [Collybia nuda]